MERPRASSARDERARARPRRRGGWRRVGPCGRRRRTTSTGPARRRPGRRRAPRPAGPAPRRSPPRSMAASPMTARRSVEWPTSAAHVRAEAGRAQAVPPGRPVGPVPRDAGSERADGHVLDEAEHVEDGLEDLGVVGTERCERQGAVADHDGRDAVQRHRVDRRVPPQRGVVVRVGVDEAGRHDATGGVELGLAVGPRARGPTSTIVPARTRTSAVTEGAPVPSTTVPPRTRRSPGERVTVDSRASDSAGSASAAFERPEVRDHVLAPLADRLHARLLRDRAHLDQAHDLVGAGVSRAARRSRSRRRQSP